ncbi:hypothetical protein Pcinc_038998 [Petrolisthes cinctipes]|uniref:K Homology domain-containing protein n=1 Tax=Petrolisthes cinctipes TaxID=88211 RepID=A0AAE1BPD3_PETCI|nr:hypothetical protein Pcinc_038998 [Petrolisthes cinctipes]
MKVALGAAAALTGAGALLYILWRPRRSPRNTPEQHLGSLKDKQVKSTPSSQKSSDTGDPNPTDSCSDTITTEQGIPKPDESLHTDTFLGSRKRKAESEYNIDTNVNCDLETKPVNTDAYFAAGTCENYTDTTKHDTSACEKGCEVIMTRVAEVKSVPCNKESDAGEMAMSEICNLTQACVNQEVKEELNEVVYELSVIPEKCQTLPVSESNKTIERETDYPNNYDSTITAQVVKNDENVTAGASKDTSRVYIDAFDDISIVNETFHGIESLSNEVGHREDKNTRHEPLSKLMTAVETDKPGQIEEVFMEVQNQTVKNSNDCIVSEISNEIHIVECRNIQKETANPRELEEEEEGRTKTQEEKGEKKVLGQYEKEAIEQLLEVSIEPNTEEDPHTHSSEELGNGEAASTHISIEVKEVCPSHEVENAGNQLADASHVEEEKTVPQLPREVVTECRITEEDPVINIDLEEKHMSNTIRLEEPITISVTQQKAAVPGNLTNLLSTEIQEGHISKVIVSDEQEDCSAIVCQAEEQQDISINSIDQQISASKEGNTELSLAVEEKINAEFGNLTCKELVGSEREDSVSEATEPHCLQEKNQEDVNQSKRASSEEVEDVVEDESKSLSISVKHTVDEKPMANPNYQGEMTSSQVEEKEKHQKLENRGDEQQGKSIASFSQEEVEKRDLEKEITVESQGEEQEKQVIPKPNVMECSEAVADYQAEKDLSANQKQQEEVVGNKSAEKEATKKEVKGTKQEKVMSEKQAPSRKGKPEVKAEGKKKTQGKKQRKGDHHKVEGPVQEKLSSSNVQEGVESGNGILEEKTVTVRKQEKTEKNKEEEEKKLTAKQLEDMERRKKKIKKVISGGQEEEKKVEDERKEKVITNTEKKENVVIEKEEDEVSSKEQQQQQQRSQGDKREDKVVTSTDKEEDVVIEKDEDEVSSKEQHQTQGDQREEKVVTSTEKEEDVVIEKDEDEVNGKEEEEEQHQQRTRGDSASADLELDLGSEQESQNYDASSLQSVDSGQGSSEIEPETLFVPSTYPAPAHDQYIFYDFEIPQTLVGRLIGRRGAFVNKIKATTDATVVVHPHRNRRLKLCSVEGSRQQVAAALKMIREQFPESRYSDVTLEQVSGNISGGHDPAPALDNQTMQMELTAGVVVEVRVSAVVSAGELWVQQPLHPSFSALHRLHTCMNLNYQDGSTTPLLPSPIQERTVCVGRVGEQWMRCQVLREEEGGGVLVVLLDMGGNINLPLTALRQIRYDYMTLPFQATQCFLQGIQPSEDGEVWSNEATEAMRELVGDMILFAAVVSYTPDCVPLISLYRRDHDQFVHLNERLVGLGHAQWLSQQSS